MMTGRGQVITEEAGLAIYREAMEGAKEDLRKKAEMRALLLDNRDEEALERMREFLDIPKAHSKGPNREDASYEQGERKRERARA